MRAIIPNKVKNILYYLCLNKHDAFIVGGACRDFLLNKDVSDFDITTSATPEQISSLFPLAIVAGNSFLVSIIDEIEIATFRKDRADKAIPAKTLEEDVSRRDFTINAIAYDSGNNEFIDHTNGLSDIENKILRFVGNPEQRIIEDPVRILRGIRFAAKYNLTIERETFFAIMIHKKLVQNIPAERIQKEIIKAFEMNNTHRFLTMLDEFELLETLFPGIHALKNIDGGGHHNETVINHCLGAVKAIEEKSWILKLAALYHDAGKHSPEVGKKGWNSFPGHNKLGLDLIESDLRDKLKFSNKTIDYIKCLTLNHMAETENCDDKNIKKLAAKLDKYNVPFKDFCYLRYADNKSNTLSHSDFKESIILYKKYLKIMKEKPLFSVKDLAANGLDVMNIFKISPGEEVGKILNSLFELVEEGLINDKETLLSKLEDMKNEK